MITYSELQKSLKATDYQIFTKLPIADVIDSEIYSGLRKKEKNLFKASHFDFVITSNDQIPLFAVEFDGSHHAIFEKTIKRDIRNNRICQLAELPLIRVTDVELEQYDSISVLQFIAYRFVKWQKEHQRILDDINSEVNEMPPEEIESLTQNGFLDPSIDSSFRFDLEFPFPSLRQVQQEITKYHLNPSASKKDNKAMWYTLSPYGESSTKGLYQVTSSYGIYKGNSASNRYSWRGGKLENDDVDILVEGTIKFGMKWALISEELILYS